MMVIACRGFAISVFYPAGIAGCRPAAPAVPGRWRARGGRQSGTSAAPKGVRGTLLRKLLLGCAEPQTLLGTSAANVNLSGQSPSVLLTQDRSVTQKPHWGFHCSVSAPQTRILSAYYIYNVLSRLCKITIINMPVILAIISVTGNVHHTAFKPIK